MMSLLCLALLTSSPAHAADPPDEVTLSLPEFLRIYEKSKEEEKTEEPAPPPRKHALSRAIYTGEVVFDDDEPTAAVFKARFTVEVLQKKGWARVPLLNAGVAVQRARIGGVDAALVLENGQYVLVTERTGRFEVEIDFAVSVNTRSGSSGFSFPLEPSGATELSLSVPTEQDLDFTVANARLKTDRVQGKNRIVEATLPATGSLAVSWQRQLQKSEEVKPRLYSEVHTLVGVGDGLIRATATIHETILFAGVDRFEVEIPDAVKVLDVKGGGLSDWTMSEGVLTLLLNYEAEGSYQFTVELEGSLDERVAAPIVKPVGVERAKGWVGVQALGALEVKAGEVENASVVDVRTLPAGIVGVTGTPVLLGYKYLASDASIPLLVNEHEEVDVLVTLLDQAVATTMFTRDGRRLTSVRYQVRNNRRQFLRLKLPVGAELWSASVAGRAVQPAQAEGRILIPLIRSKASGGALAAFGVEVVYVESGSGPDASGRGRFQAELPTADAPTTYVAWKVYSPLKAKIGKRSYQGTLRHVDSLSRHVCTQKVMNVASKGAPMRKTARRQASSGGLGQGAAPVTVNLPLDGRATFFEKLLVLDDSLEVAFRYRGLK